MELIQVANFLNGRYLLTNIKKDKQAVLKGNLLATYSVDHLSASKNEKIYYDTNDYFFANRGINIYTVAVNKTEKELIIRYDAEQVQRIDFLKNTPNFFKLRIGLKDDIRKYYNEISEAIYKVYPSGLGINTEEYLRNSSPQVTIRKKRDSYRVVNNKGLKVTMSFDDCTYINKRGKKSSQQTLDIVGDAFKTKDEFNEFLREIVLDYPKLIKIASNELMVAKNCLQ